MDERNPTSAPEGIAIIGMSGRFPGAGNVDQFWHNLVQGVDSMSRFGEAELEYSVATPEAIAQGQKFIRARGVIDGADLFDADFFGMYPREAQLIDPQHRLFLECAWEALESAGHAPDNYPGLIGVYAGLAMNTYLLHNLCVDERLRPISARTIRWAATKRCSAMTRTLCRREYRTNSTFAARA